MIFLLKVKSTVVFYQIDELKARPETVGLNKIYCELG